VGTALAKTLSAMKKPRTHRASDARAITFSVGAIILALIVATAFALTLRASRDLVVGLVPVWPWW